MQREREIHSTRVAERFVKEREKNGPTMGIIQPCGQSGRSPNALLKQTWNLLPRKHGTCTTTYVKSKGLMIKHVEISSDLTRTNQEKVVTSRSDCEHEYREFIVGSGASLHMMSKSELTSGEKDAIGRSREPTVITTANGKAESTEEAAVHVNDLDALLQ